MNSMTRWFQRHRILGLLLSTAMSPGLSILLSNVCRWIHVGSRHWPCSIMRCCNRLTSNRLLVSIGTGGLGIVAGGNLDYISFVPLDAGFGDFSGDGSLDADDIDMLSRAALIRDADLVFDVDRSGAVDGVGRRYMGPQPSKYLRR